MLNNYSVYLVYNDTKNKYNCVKLKITAKNLTTLNYKVRYFAKLNNITSYKYIVA